MPKSLYGQMLLVAASALLVAQGINTMLLLAGIRSRAIGETATLVVSRVANQIERQESSGIPIGQADRRTRRNRDNPQRRRRPPLVAITVDAAPVDSDGASAEYDIADRAEEFLRQGEISLSDVRISTIAISQLPPQLSNSQLQRWQARRFRNPQKPVPDKAILFSARLPDGRWVNAAGFVRPNENASIIALLLQTLTLFAAVMIPLAIFARRIANPLLQLTDRVQRVGLTNEIGPMPTAGPTDVRQLIEAFNKMQSRVTTLLGEKDVMLGAIGHDLKTPLASLRVRVESVDDDDERAKMPATIDEMVTILDDILALARLGKSSEPLQPVDIGALVDEIASEYNDIAFDPPTERVVAKVRPVLLRRALRNLIGNAITYGKVAEIEIREIAGAVLIEIRDQGPGIDPAIIETMFEPFIRAERSRSRATGGSGLGLTIARAIARSHGGDVILTNRLNGGLCATLSIQS